MKLRNSRGTVRTDSQGRCGHFVTDEVRWTTALIREHMAFVAAIWSRDAERIHEMQARLAVRVMMDAFGAAGTPVAPS